MWLFPNDLLSYQTQSLIICILRKKNQRKSQTIGISMDQNSWWSLITPPSPKPQTLTLKPKIVLSLSFNVIKPITSNSHSSKAKWGSRVAWKKTPHPSDVQQRTQHQPWPSSLSFFFNLWIFSFGFCLVFETSLWVFVLLLILVFL